MYVIWNKRIWGSYAASSGWRAYGGASPHTDHVHISLSRAGASGATSFWTGRVAGTPAPKPRPRPPSRRPRPRSPRPRAQAHDARAEADDAGPEADDARAEAHHPGARARPRPPPSPRRRRPAPSLPPPVPAPALEPGPALEDEQLQVLPQRDGATTTGALVAGERYRVEVRGTWRYGPAGREVADAECSTTARDDDWERSRRVPGAPAGDAYGLHLDGRDLSLRAPGEDDDECGEHGHTYATTITAARSGRVPLAVWEPATAAGWADNSGALQVRLVHLAPRDRLEVDVDVRDPHGTTTAGSVVEDAVYLVTATGTWSPEPGVLADAMCEHEPDDDWERGDGLVLGDDRAPRLRCRDDHTYRFLWRADDSGPLVGRGARPRLRRAHRLAARRARAGRGRPQGQAVRRLAAALVLVPLLGACSSPAALPVAEVGLAGAPVPVAPLPVDPPADEPVEPVVEAGPEHAELPPGDPGVDAPEVPEPAPADAHAHGDEELPGRVPPSALLDRRRPRPGLDDRDRRGRAVRAAGDRAAGVDGPRRRRTAAGWRRPWPSRPTAPRRSRTGGAPSRAAAWRSRRWCSATRARPRTARASACSSRPPSRSSSCCGRPGRWPPTRACPTWPTSPSGRPAPPRRTAATSRGQAAATPCSVASSSLGSAPSRRGPAPGRGRRSARSAARRRSSSP